MEAFEIGQLQEQAKGNGPYFEFLRHPSLSVGVYTLTAGATDPQEPHAEDEVYYVLAGQATLTVEGQEQPVHAGSLVYVPAGAVHRFHTIEKDLTVLVFFAPAESS